MNASEFFGAMFDPLKKFADFNGRSTRGQFWPFVFFWYALQQIVAWIAMAPLMEKINKISEAAAIGEAEAEAAVANLNFGMVTDMITRLSWMSGGMMALLLLPMAAAITRRLHDTNRSGFWALPCLILLFVSYFLLWRVAAPYLGSNAQPLSMDIVSELVPVFIVNFIYLIMTIVLIVFCVKDGTIGPNNYGEDPKGRSEGDEIPKFTPAYTPSNAATRSVAKIAGAPSSEPAPVAEPKRSGPARIIYDTPPSGE
jgi:uncharacterized membrane protein YhaH (DUF805 family)